MYQRGQCCQRTEPYFNTEAQHHPRKLVLIPPIPATIGSATDADVKVTLLEFDTIESLPTKPFSLKELLKIPPEAQWPLASS